MGNTKDGIPREVPAEAIAGGQEVGDSGKIRGRARGLFCKWVRRNSLPPQGKTGELLIFAKTTLVAARAPAEFVCNM